MTRTHLARKDLRHLRDLALEEHVLFFRRNPHLQSTYRRALVAICLCQGAALHHLNPRSRLEDFDVWHFYWDSRQRPFPYRAHAKGKYRGKRVDFLKRAIPKELQRGAQEPGQVILEYLKQRNTRTKRELLRKVIIGLFPSRIFGDVLWRGEITEVR
jgi:hypothetical protein